MSVEQRIQEQLASDRVVLYMKGTPAFPQCGFSGRVVQCLQACGAEFTAINVLEDPEIREGIKVHGNWPTIPQLYVDRELIGGCDIVVEQYESGELQQLFA